jgi:hypothetical protein
MSLDIRENRLLHGERLSKLKTDRLASVRRACKRTARPFRK